MTHPSSSVTRTWSLGAGSCATGAGRDIPQSREMSPSLQPGVAVPENDTDGSARTPLEMLRGVTRRVATADSLEVVLQSIAAALVEQADAANARIFLALTDADCPVCHATGAGGSGSATYERALHCVASAGHTDEEGIPHRVPLDSELPPAIQWRLREPILVAEWDQFEQFAVPAATLRAWREMGISSAAGYSLEFRGEQLGSIGFLARRRIKTEEFALLGIFADQAALAIRNAQLYREVEQYRDRLARENAYLQEAIAEAHGFEGIVGESPALRAVLRKVQQVAPVETTVLLTGRNRHRQGAHRPGAAPGEPPARPAADQGQLRGHPRRAGGERALRAREGGVHRGAAAADRALRAGRRRDAVPGRGRRAAAGDPGEAAAGAAGAGVRAGGRHPDAAGGRAGGGGDQPGPGAGGGRRAASGRTCSTGSTCSPSGCRPCGSGPSDIPLLVRALPGPVPAQAGQAAPGT